MARKVINRRELREANDAAEKLAKDKPEPKAKKAKAEPGTKAPRKSRAKTAKEVRLKAFWGVFDQSMKRVALYEYSQRPEADKKAADLMASKKTAHFVQMVKEVME